MHCIGHETIISFFTTCIATQKLSHAYTFCGPKHVGKRTIAEYVARMILGISSAHAFTHPDLIIVEREIDEKTGTLKKDISIGQIRDLIHRLSQSAFTKDGYTVALIDGVEYLNTAGANALLKTLEEPSSRTVIFMITQDESTLLPTIRSRAQSIFFSPVSRGKIQTYLESQGLDSVRAQEYARESHGLPGYACGYFADSAKYEAYMIEKQRCTALIGIPFYEKISRIEDFFQDRDDHIEARARIIDILAVWTFTIRDMTIEQIRTGERKNTLYRVLDMIRQSEKQLTQNIHPRLILEHLMLALP